MPSQAMLVHVPVDEIEIISGPGPMWLVQVIADLYMRKSRIAHVADAVYAEVEFTLKTLASNTSFRRKLRIAEFELGDVDPKEDFGNLDRDCFFTAVFNGEVVSGTYNLKHRTGWFNVD